ncbi:MAG: hypothetical protein V4736_12045 [Bdellovibrionota bacterium]
MLKLLILLSLFSSVGFAARLEDVKILSAVPGQDSFELKLHANEGASDSFFFIEIVKSDPDSLEKMNHVFKKLMKKEKYRLDLDIMSFSVSPNGSVYRSEGIGFYGSDNRKPNNVPAAKKKKSK